MLDLRLRVIISAMICFKCVKMKFRFYVWLSCTRASIMMDLRQDETEEESIDSTYSITVVTFGRDKRAVQVTLENGETLQFPAGYFKHLTMEIAFKENDVAECRKWLYDTKYYILANPKKYFCHIQSFELFALALQSAKDMKQYHCTKPKAIWLQFQVDLSMLQLLLLTNMSSEQEFVKCLQFIVAEYANQLVRSNADIQLFAYCIARGWKQAFKESQVFCEQHVQDVMCKLIDFFSTATKCDVNCLTFAYVYKQLKQLSHVETDIFFVIFYKYTCSTIPISITPFYLSFLRFYHKVLLQCNMQYEVRENIREQRSKLEFAREYLSTQLSLQSCLSADVLSMIRLMIV